MVNPRRGRHRRRRVLPHSSVGRGSSPEGVGRDEAAHTSSAIGADPAARIRHYALVAETELDRDRLLSLLASAPASSSSDLCSDDVTAGSPYRVFGEHEHPDQLVQTYSRRVAGAARRGIATFG